MKIHRFPGILCLTLCLVSLSIPEVGTASYAIHLRNGGRIATPQYWKEGQKVFFSVTGGVAGIEESTISRIETLADEAVLAHETGRPEGSAPPAEQTAETRRIGDAKQAPGTTPSPSQKPPQLYDLKAAQAKMTALKGALNKARTRIRQAKKDGDEKARGEANADYRRIQVAIYQLSDEVKAHHHGKLPADWWQGWDETSQRDP